ncbi:hypothetical protein PUMCH_003926 [Australozyma saopauloensis]|uniref:PX domain-containing protein n=1 Tax=Australozyma saopauloensis TaxID=291208 RepID=A0AAX4HDE9_9ASCO|nr:hypothetical protein PUMCH_003926 [[Candida] saopauloensis]
MDDSDIFPEFEQDNNPLLHQPAPAHASSANSGASAVPGKVTPPSSQTRTTSPSGQALQDSFVDFSSTALVNNSLGLLQKIRRLLAAGPKLSIDVVSSELLAGTKVMVYVIQLSLEKLGGPVIVKRRYLEFKSLRDTLVKLFPTTVVPPIPEKHSLLTYLINSIDSSREVSVVEVRRRQFAKFLQDVVFEELSAQLKECPLFLKFLDPNYELAWENAMHEPPVSLLPQNLLLANPNDPTDQNGLYYLMPRIAGFDINAPDNLPALRKINDDLHKLYGDVSLYNLKETRNGGLKHMTEDFSNIPTELVNFETNFHQNIRVLSEMHKLNNKNVRNLELMIKVLIELGANLNNFSLQIHEMVSVDNNKLSNAVEKFGSTLDSSFLNFEHFLYAHVTPAWEEPITQFIQYYFSALQLIKFYKYKLLQYKLLYKLKFSKVQELASFTYNQQSIQRLKDLDIDSPSIQSAIRRIESKLKLKSSQAGKSWYGLFGGNKTASFTLPDDRSSLHSQASMEASSTLLSGEGSPDRNIQSRIEHIEKELDKLDQLINLFNGDLSKLTSSLEINLQEYQDKMEKKWLTVMLALVKAGTQLFEENLACWREFKSSFGEIDRVDITELINNLGSALSK